MKKVVHSPADPTAYTTYLSFPELTFGDNTETYYNLDNNALDKIECTRDQIGFILTFQRRAHRLQIFELFR